MQGQIKVIDKGFPRIQVNIRVETLDQKPIPVTFALELVGLFEYIGEQPEADANTLNDFMAARGLHMLWPYITQMIRVISAQMGMNPLQFKTPLDFELRLENAAPIKVDEDK